MMKINTYNILFYIFIKFFIYFLNFNYLYSFNTNEPNILIITDIINNSTASKIGLKKWDIIYSFNDKEFYNKYDENIGQEFKNQIKEKNKLIILRNGNKIEFNFKISGKNKILGIYYQIIKNKPSFYYNKALDKINKIESINELKENINNLEIVKALSPKWYIIYYNLGLLYHFMDEYENAVNNFTQCLLLMQNNNNDNKEIQNVKTKLEISKNLAEKLKLAKYKMANGKLIKIKREPKSNSVSIFDDGISFNIDKNDKMCLRNPQLKETSKFARSPFYYVKYNKKISNIEVNWEGKKFIAIWSDIIEIQENDYFYYIPHYYKIEGEINLNNNEITIKVYNKLDYNTNCGQKLNNELINCLNKNALNYNFNTNNLAYIYYFKII